MSTDPGRRAGYLEALGIDVWVPRTALPGGAPGKAPAPSIVAASIPTPTTSSQSALATHVDASAVAVVEQPPSAIGLRGLTEAPSATEQRSLVQPQCATEPQSPAQPPSAAATAAAAVTAPTAAVVAATGTATTEPAAADWEGLRQQVLACTRCELHRGRTQAVFASGDPQARWMVVGEAPGAEEDRQGQPFVGRAGQLLNAMLAAIGLPRPRVFVANMIKCRPPQNRDPRPEELAACRPYLERQFELLRPTLILVVGRIAAQNLLGTDAPLGRLRGRVHHAGRLNLPVIVTYHPAYLLRSPADKRKAWEDLKLARRVFGERASQGAS